MTRVELAHRYLRMAELDPENAEYLRLAAQLADRKTWLAWANQWPPTDPRSCTCEVNEGPYHAAHCPRRRYWDAEIGLRMPPRAFYGDSNV